MDKLFEIVTLLVTFILGIFSKRCSYINNKIIPIQNLLVGIISSIIYYLYTKDINLVIAATGIFAGGTYDIISNLKKLIVKEKE